MSTKKIIVTFLFSIVVLLVSGQIHSHKSEEFPYIEVTGTAEKEVVPNEIYIGIIIREKYVNRNKITIEEQEEKLKEALTRVGVDLTNLFLSDVNADYVNIRWQKDDVLTKKNYTLKVSSASTVGKVFLELEKLEITDAFISKVSHSEIDSLRKEVRILAIKAAKEKADYLLEAIGEETGKPIVIKENASTNVANASNVNHTNRSKVGTLSDSYLETSIDKKSEIQFKKILIRTSIYVKFLIQ